jgi:hypothetical protein
MLTTSNIFGFLLWILGTAFIVNGNADLHHFDGVVGLKFYVVAPVSMATILFSIKIFVCPNDWSPFIKALISYAIVGAIYEVTGQDVVGNVVAFPFLVAGQFLLSAITVVEACRFLGFAVRYPFPFIERLLS